MAYKSGLKRGGRAPGKRGPGRSMKMGAKCRHCGASMKYCRCNGKMKRR